MHSNAVSVGSSRQESPQGGLVQLLHLCLELIESHEEYSLQYLFISTSFW